MKLSKGLKDEGVLVGNVFDKYYSRNPIARKLMTEFDNALNTFVQNTAPETIHEVGCGEGYWVLQWKKKGFKARGSDFSSMIIEIAQANAIEKGFSPRLFEAKSIYELKSETDTAELVVCCEVLEHLEYPEESLAVLSQVAKNHLILSVPREPLWRILNLMRVKYVAHLGNTPGHIQHWSKKSFVQLIEKYFHVVEVKTPLPWTLVLCKSADQSRVL